ncbi:unnamed protein product [Prorocentrum cordatum]|uniref:Uncharacterized protein n=1 Tax=Prorocentrum cordatum TaxID=2364126 RepID=A0ABN9V4F4_9DINO|nr:unnamed protein product [Polarella glacialis]
MAVASTDQDAQASTTVTRPSRGWELSVGALSLGSSGVALKPQFKFGAQIGNFTAEAGLHDLRDGLKISAEVEAAMAVEASGMSMQEVHDSIQCDTPGFREALDAAKVFMSNTTEKFAGIARSIGISKERLESALDGKCIGKKCTPMTLRVQAEIGAGFSAHVCLGWKDTQGFNMVGVGGKASAAVSLSVSAFAGRHSKNKAARILLGITNFKFQYTFPIGSLESQCPDCRGAGTVKGSGFMGVGKQQCPTCGGLGEIAVGPEPGQVASDSDAEEKTEGAVIDDPPPALVEAQGACGR